MSQQVSECVQNPSLLACRVVGGSVGFVAPVLKSTHSLSDPNRAPRTLHHKYCRLDFGLDLVWILGWVASWTASIAYLDYTQPSLAAGRRVEDLGNEDQVEEGWAAQAID